MTCPTCGYALNLVSEDNSLHWCSRCGTLTDRNGRTATPPKLVAHCRKLLTTTGHAIMTDLEREIADAVVPPGESL